MADFKIFNPSHIILNIPRYCGFVWFSTRFITYSRRTGVKVTIVKGCERDILKQNQQSETA